MKYYHLSSKSFHCDSWVSQRGTWIQLEWFCEPNKHRTWDHLRSKSMDWFLYDNGLHHERVKDPIVIMKEIMSWLFKVPIVTVAYYSWSTMPDQTIKNGLKDQIAPNKIFFWKTTNKIFLSLFAPFILQNFKNFLKLLSRVMRMCHFQAQNGKFVVNKIFFGTNHYYYTKFFGKNY